MSKRTIKGTQLQRDRKITQSPFKQHHERYQSLLEKLDLWERRQVLCNLHGETRVLFYKIYKERLELS